MKRGAAVLVGRSNVGKSTLFNRLVSNGNALVSSVAGTTRDRNYGLIEWLGKHFWVADTGGYDPASREAVTQQSQKQTARALADAKVALLVIDGQTGLLPEDRTLAQYLRKLKLPTIVVVNKIDGPSQRQRANIPSLGFDTPILVSAKNGSGVGDLLDQMVRFMNITTPLDPEVSIAFLGKTNVGKSSLFNYLLRDERSLVLPTPHTTRDRLHEFLQWDGQLIEIIDTAGVRRQLKHAPRLEQQSVRQSEYAVEQGDVNVLIVDGATPFSWQDQRLGDLITRAKTAAVVLLNKADLVPQKERANILKELGHWLPMVSWANILWTSTVTGEGVKDIIPHALEAYARWQKELPDEAMSDFFKFLKRTRPTRDLPLISFIQTGTQPPAFTVTLKTKATIPTAVALWIEGQLRRRFDFIGSPVRVSLYTTTRPSKPPRSRR